MASIEGVQFKGRWRAGDEKLFEWLKSFVHGQQSDVIRLALYILAGARPDDLPGELRPLLAVIGWPGEASPGPSLPTETGNLARVLADAIDRMGDKIAGAVTPANPTMIRPGYSTPPVLEHAALTEGSGLDMSRPRSKRTIPQAASPATPPEVWTEEHERAARETLIRSINNYGKGQ